MNPDAEWKFDIEWVDFGREPTCRPDPHYPQGIDVDVSAGREPNCTVELPYPAKRCGSYHIVCSACKLTVAISTAGRADDPRSVKVACKRRLQ